ncbi:hypothetical protein [Actinoallomurus iriomotensis]|uniref:Uncharacterized protein n=1 Tax=Actinoallomurus iriomotensis TaxID=478107 RepID=A0A9W6S3P6_9ACTN|nr:hypothetical protein [Actinoallomurus iriomotensis]GLY88001.1 hypothetical protein Airi02_059300 [Actinoallomurus iriomotensis]
MTVEVDTTARAGTVPMTRAQIGQAMSAFVGGALPLILGLALASTVGGRIVTGREALLRTSNAVGDDHEDGPR